MSTSSLSPRCPNFEERNQLIHSLCETCHDREDAQRFVEDAAIAVFDHYATDGPGYAGKIMSVVWAGSPSMASVYTWQKGELVEVELD